MTAMTRRPVRTGRFSLVSSEIACQAHACARPHVHCTADRSRAKNKAGLLEMKSPAIPQNWNRYCFGRAMKRS